MFVIKDADGGYFHKKQQIILFETSQLAQNFANAYINYCMQRVAQENPLNTFAVMQMASGLQIIEPDFDINSSEVKTITFREIEEQYRK